MKPGKNADRIIENQKCSCTSCVYKSSSDPPSLRRFIAKGSKIDRLYYGKYIPLRERKLLERLVRTRGVYDDIRAQLLSDSTLSSNKPDLNPENRLPVNELPKESSSAILQLVNLVDKGAELGSKKLSDCCSCCSCSSKVHVHERVKKTHRLRRGHPGGRAYEYGYIKEQIGGEYRKKRGVRFKSKHIRSDPCLCTLKFSGLIKNQSKALLRKIRRDYSVPALEIKQTTEENVKKRNKLQELSRASFEKVRESNMRMKEFVSEGARKVIESKNVMEKNIRVNTKRSVEKIKDAKDKLKQKIKAEGTKGHTTTKPKDIEKDLLMSCLCPEKELFFKIKKDSVSKFKDDLKKKQLRKDWACEPECIEDTCVPEECFKKLKLRILQRRKSRKKYSKDIVKQDRKIGDLLNKSDVRIQSKSQLVNTRMGTERQKQILHADRTQETVQSRHNFEAKSKKEIVPKVEIDVKKNVICDCDNTSLPKKTDSTYPKKLNTKIALAPSASPSPLRKQLIKKEYIEITHRPGMMSNAKDKYEKVQIMSPPVIVKPKPEQKQSHRQAVRIGSSFSFNVEFYKDRSGSNASYTESTYHAEKVRHKTDKRKKLRKRRQKGSQVKLNVSPKNTQSGSHALKRCFCTLKLKSKKNKQKVSKLEKGTTTAVSSSSGPFQNDFNFECSRKSCKKDPSRCINQVCDFLEYDRRWSNKANEIGTNTKLKIKKNLKLSKSGKRKKKDRQLLPYECDPGVCIPGDCNPKECIKLINQRERKKKLKNTASGSYPCSCETKTTASFTFKSITPLKVKRVQSNIPIYRKSIPKTSREFILTPKKISGHQNRQAVRIGSSFSFNIDFYKDKTPATPIPTNVKSITFKPKVKQEVPPKQHRALKKKSTPTLINKKERNVHVGTTLKRCFCTLKLQKKEYTKRKNKMLTTGTETINPRYLTIEMSSKGTKINRKDRNLLEPFECEPFSCIPGSCDPYICLETIKKRIKKRNVRLKNIGLKTTSPVMITESSSTELEKTSKPVQIKIEPPSKNHKTLTKSYSRKKYIKQKKQLASGHSSMKSKRAVRLGSTFSFDIQFYKNQYYPPEEEFKYQPNEMPLKISTNKKFKDKAIKKKVSNTSHVDTQIKVHRHNKGSLVKPMLKKCFCTLNLVKKQNKQHRRNEFLKNKALPLIYTVNKVITANTTFAGFMDSAIYKNRQCSSVSNKFFGKYINLRTTSTNSKTTNVKPDRLEKFDKLFSEVSFIHSNKINESLVHIEKYSMRRNTIKSREAPITQSRNNTEKNQRKNCEKQLNCLSLTGLHRYFRRYYYTMNVQTKNIQMLNKQKRTLETGLSNRNWYNGRKLEHYECEPGVCIPGECNPYDCQKLILERIKKHSAKKSGTESKSRTISSYTGRNRLHFDSNKNQKTEKSATSQLKRKKLVSAKNCNKQAVRLGSSFSFDIEFFKGNSNFSKGGFEPKYFSDTKLERHVKQRPKKFKASSTKGQEVNSIDQQSQSGSLMADKVSHTVIDTKRCFCTLKLQKKGRLYKGHAKKDKIIKINKEPNVTMSTRGQNTLKLKPVTVKRNINPYECEPGICVPGYCDPYKCLEIMKLKKADGQQLGTNTKYSSNSVSSMTMSLQKRYRDRAIGAKNKKRSSKPISTRKYKENKGPMKSRQCVRIGSSFNFNVEFYKDNPTNLRYKENFHNITNENILVNNKKITKQKGSQKYNDSKHMDSQSKILPLNASTMTKSLLKRCFCTAQLHAPKVMQQTQTKQPGSFKRRCMCMLKLLKRSKLPYTPEKVEVTKPLLASKKNNTRYTSDLRPLELNECLPGICVPGECDPYKCYEIMNKRRNDTYSRSAATSTFKARPVGSNTSEVLTKDRKTQMMLTKAAHTKRETYIKTPTPHKNGSDRQAVKIGSNFSFNVEFYKQNLSAINGKVIPKLKKIENVNPSRIKVRKPKIKSSGANVRPISFSTTRTQVLGVKNTNRAIGTESLLKRCFCILKLQNQRKQENKKKKQSIMEPTYKNVETKSVMTVEKIKWHSKKLEPYECEPNVCIPYQCDPVECEKIIMRRLKQQKNPATASQEREPFQKIKWRSVKLLPYECEPNVCIPYECDPYECGKRIEERLKKERYRESGTSTTNRRKTREASTTDKLFAPKVKNQHTLNKPHASHYQQSIGVIKNESFEHPSRQSVKIGSSFTFNIEFYKNKDGIEVVKKPKPKNGTPVKSHFKVNKHIKKQLKQRGSQKLRDKRQSKIIQFENETTKSQATMTNASPFSNRCFCTLYVRKPKKEKRSTIDKQRIPVTSDASTETNKPQKLKLLPYECEPQTCIPGECSPFECLERIKMRKYNKRNIGVTTTHYSKSVGRGVSGISTKSKNKNIQTKHIAVIKNEDSKNKGANSLNLGTTPRQGVRIGSNFSFDIEFYKDRIVDNNLKMLTSRQAEIKNLASKNKTTLDVNSIRHVNTQVLSNATKSVNSGISPIWKKCFCTLKLQKDARHTNDLKSHSSKKSYFNRNIGVNNLTNPGRIPLNISNSGIRPFMKKCFCDLKLHLLGNQKKQNGYKKENKKLNTLKDIQQATNRNLEPYECEPGICVPGLCNPYECEKKIRMRGQENKSQTTATRRVKYCPKSVGVKSRSLKTQKIQSDLSDCVNGFKSNLEPKQQPRFIEVPRFSNIANKNVVRIGSNFNLNLEFYKETVPETVIFKTDRKMDIKNSVHITRKPKYAVNKKMLVKDHAVNRKLQNDLIKTDEKGSGTGNKLKRCFCTLKLQKKEFSKDARDKIVYPVSIKDKFPQIFDVRRVTVQKIPKNLTNSKFPDVKSVATKVSTKFLKQCVCQDRRNINIDDMYTILPYVPTKFNKKASKTLLATYDRHKQASNILKPNKVSLGRGRKLTKKRSHKSINKEEPKNNNRKSFLHRLFCKCMKNQSTNISNTETSPCDVDTCDYPKQNNINCKNILKNEMNLRFSKSDRHHKHLTGPTTYKSKSLKMLKKQEKSQRSRSMLNSEMFSNSPIGDVGERRPRMSINKNKAIFNKPDVPNLTKNMHDQTYHRGQKQLKSTILKHGNGNGEHSDILCTHCELQLKKKVRFQDSLSVHKQKINNKLVNKSKKIYELPSRNTKSRIFSTKELKNSQKISKSCNYCDLCGSHVDKEEIQKAAGDRRQSKLTVQKTNNFLMSTSDKIKNIFNCHDNDNICSGEKLQKPLFEMKLDSQDYDILNKDEVVHSVTMLKNKIRKDQAKAKREKLTHGKSCRCCICLGKNQNGAYIKVAAKGSKVTGLFGNIFGGEKTTYVTGKPCVCGSEVCAKELKKMSIGKHRKTQMPRWKPCECGSPVCEHESDMIKILSTSPDELMCQCMQEMAKRQKALLKAKKKEEAKKRATRLKKYKKEDENRRKRRIKENQLEEKSVKENARQNDSDLLLLAESVLDAAKLGFTATSDTVRCAARTVTDPKGAYASLSALKDDPSLLFRGAKNAVADSGVASTLRRIKYRWCAMRAVNDVKKLMEQHPLTNFLLHITDKTGDRRSGRKKKGVRERFDFNCSLYMASLRKRPCLCVYDRCPWFYPHFMSILNVWRQFSDIVLFLIAVAVWSPCILAMEVCRAMMCCFLCTG